MFSLSIFLKRGFMNIQQDVLNKSSINDFFSNIISNQINYENQLLNNFKKQSGTFLTNTVDVIDRIIDIIKIDDDIFNKKILEPSCGQGIFLLRLISNLYKKYPSKKQISGFIENNIIFNDINPEMLESTKSNLKNLYFHLFNEEYIFGFNSFCFDFTKKILGNSPGLFDVIPDYNPLEQYYGKIDYIIGNPPYVTLYGRRDKKQNEEQRIYFLNNYLQFPDHVKNGKINFVMLFIEHSLDFLKQSGELSLIIDISFFETAYKYTRKYILENSEIISIDFNIKEFDVASGQIVLKLKNKKNINNEVKIYNAENNQVIFVKQKDWYKPQDEYKFRITQCDVTDSIINRINLKSQKSLIDVHPKKNLRTCTMLLDMEDKFVSPELLKRNEITIYPYYQGSKSLSGKFSNLSYNKYFYYDKKLQDSINDDLKIKLEAEGIKNKKRIGLGEIIVYDNPKIYIRQSAKEIIASYDETKSSANNSLYVFSLRDDSPETLNFLKFLCGYLNSDLVTFYAQKRNIIRFTKGKQPQIKISDLYSIKIPMDKKLQDKITELVNSIYNDKSNIDNYVKKINVLLYNYYEIGHDEIQFVRESIRLF